MIEERIIKDATKWCFLLNQADIGDVVMINGIMIMVKENTEKAHCKKCPFSDHMDGCYLVRYGDAVTPCSPFNNKLGKSLSFTYEITKEKLESLI